MQFEVCSPVVQKTCCGDYFQPLGINLLGKPYFPVKNECNITTVRNITVGVREIEQPLKYDIVNKQSVEALIEFAKAEKEPRIVTTRATVTWLLKKYAPPNNLLNLKNTDVFCLCPSTPTPAPASGANVSIVATTGVLAPGALAVGTGETTTATGGTTMTTTPGGAAGAVLGGGAAGGAPGGTVGMPP